MDTAANSTAEMALNILGQVIKPKNSKVANHAIPVFNYKWFFRKIVKSQLIVEI